MATYIVNYLVLSGISSDRYQVCLKQLQGEWTSLETGMDMTYFQTFGWYESIFPYQLKDNWLHENVIAVVKKDGETVLIAPLTIVKHNWMYLNRKGVYLLGRCGWSDYLNFIYKIFENEAIEALMLGVKEKYGICDWFFEQIREDTALFTYLSINRKNIPTEKKVCVSLNLPDTEELYMVNLAKSAKQNLRTAQNRLNKAGKDLRFVFDDKNVDKHKLVSLRASRLGKKNYEPIVYKRYKRMIKDWLLFRYPHFLPFLVDANCHVMTAYEGDEIRAFFNYGIDYVHKTILLMAVGTDETFARYSPGMLLMYAFIKEQIQKHSINIIDFTRGDEFYKYALGGKNHYLYYFHAQV